MIPNILAVCSAFFFAACSVAFANFSRRISALWMTAFKDVVALVAFGLAALFARNRLSEWPHFSSFAAFLISGFIGLGIGDIWLLKAYSAIGGARTLVIFSFQPIIVGLLALVLFGQAFSLFKMLAILFMVGCVFTVSYEKFRTEKKWDFRGPLYAVAGMLHDSVGIILTRYAFDQDARITVWEGNFYRCLGAVFCFVCISQFKPLHLFKTFKKFSRTAKMTVLGASLCGTFISLTLYLTAISTGHLATVTALLGSAPIFAGLVEAIVHRKWPSRYLYISVLFFGMGFCLLL